MQGVQDQVWLKMWKSNSVELREEQFFGENKMHLLE